VSEELLGRAVELHTAHRLLDSVMHSGARALEIRGEPGIGKSSLLHAIAEFARRKGYATLMGRASQLERDVPFGVFVDALDDHVQSIEPRRLQGLEPWVMSELAHLLPALGPAVNSVPGPDERHRGRYAVRELLARLASGTPLLLALDDVQWADLASLELLAALVRRPPRAAVLLIVALRPGPDSRVAAALAEGHRNQAIESIALSPLSELDARRLLQGRVPSSRIASLLRDTGGNPFYLKQLTLVPADLPHRGCWRMAYSPGAAGDGNVPIAVLASIAEELALLSPMSRAVAYGAAVAGDTFEPELAAAAAACDIHVALQTIDELLACDLIRPTGMPRAFAYRYPIVRRTIYQQIPGGWRLRAHQRIADALAACRASPAERAPHVEQSARRGDPEAILLLQAAGDALARRSPEAAARWYQAALHLLPGDGSSGHRRLELLSGLASSLAAAGRLGECRGALLELLAEPASRSPDEVVELVVRLASIEHLLGCHDAARARLTDALGACRDQSSLAAATIMLGFGEAGFYAGDLREIRALGEQARTIAREAGASALQAAAAALVAWAAGLGGDLVVAADARSEAALLVDTASDDELTARVDGLVYLAWAEWFLEQYSESMRHSERGIAVARAGGHGHLVAQLAQSRVACFMMVDPVRARELQEQVTDAARLTSNPTSLSWALATDAWIAYMLGELDEASRAAAECARVAAHADGSVITSLGRALGWVLQIEAGEALPGGRTALNIGPWNLYHEALTWAELRRGRIDAARRAARKAENTAARVRLRMPTCWAWRARAAVLLADGDAHAAGTLALAAAESAEAVGALLEGARSRLLAGQALIRAGERAHAETELRSAAATFDMLDARVLRAQTERELRRLGRRFRRRSRLAGVDGLASLTPRELEVAQLVSYARTNREIASELFVSEKTVETHVRHIFDKLGISSRAEIRRALVDAAPDARS